MFPGQKLCKQIMACRGGDLPSCKTIGT